MHAVIVNDHVGVESCCCRIAAPDGSLRRLTLGNTNDITHSPGELALPKPRRVTRRAGASRATHLRGHGGG